MASLSTNNNNNRVFGTDNPTESGDQSRRSSKNRRLETYNIYIFRVLKQVHPEIGISKIAMAVINSFVFDIFHRAASEARTLLMRSRKSVLSAREIQSAISLVLPCELCKHSTSEGMKSVNKFQANVSSEKRQSRRYVLYISEVY